MAFNGYCDCLALLVAKVFPGSQYSNSIPTSPNTTFDLESVAGNNEGCFS